MGLFRKKSQEQIVKEMEQKLENDLKKKLGLSSDLQGKELDDAIVSFVENENGKIRLFDLSFRQRVNNDFMLRLFNADPALTTQFVLTKEQEKDKDFMLQYYTLRHADKSCYDDYRHAWRLSLIEDPEFVTKLAEKNPDINVVRLVDRVVSYYNFDNEEKAKEVIKGLNTETLIKQVKSFGLDALQKIPSDHSEYVTFVDTAVESAGYEALKYLNVDNVLENKEIIYKAYEKDGVDAVVKYLTKDLNPNRSEGYMCHGEYHDYKYYDKHYEEVRDELLEDEKINGILEFNGLKAVKSYRTYQDLKIEEMGE